MIKLTRKECFDKLLEYLKNNAEDLDTYEYRICVLKDCIPRIDIIETVMTKFEYKNKTKINCEELVINTIFLDRILDDEIEVI